MQSPFHKCRRHPANATELECMTREKMQKIFYIDLSFKERQSFVSLFTGDIRN